MCLRLAAIATSQVSFVRNFWFIDYTVRRRPGWFGQSTEEVKTGVLVREGEVCGGEGDGVGLGFWRDVRLSFRR